MSEHISEDCIQITVMCSTFYILFIKSKCITELLFKPFFCEKKKQNRTDNVGMTHTEMQLMYNGCTVKEDPSSGRHAVLKCQKR